MAARVVVGNLAVILAAVAAPGEAQQPPPVRPIGPITSVSRDSLASVTAAVEVGGGGVFVNDITARRLLLFDSTLQNSVVVLDSSGEGASAYGTFPGTLLPYHGDSALFIAPQALSMLVLSPAGAVARVMAVPPTGGGLPALLGNVFGTPGFDAHGRLVFFSSARFQVAGPAPGGELPRLEPPDSAFIVRFDFTARALDTVGAIRIPKTRTTLNRDDQGRIRITMTAFPPLTVDDWGVTSDGRVAVVRGRDYHVDWLDADGNRTSTPRMPFGWEQLDDSSKTALIDSTAKALQAVMDSMPARLQRSGGVAAGQTTVTGGRAPAGGGPGGGGPVIVMSQRGPGASGAPTTIVPTVTPAVLADVPDYRPPFGQGAVRADRSGNLWIRTSKMVDGRPVYDVVTRKGEVGDRVQLPPFRTIAGFGPGVLYMGVRDSTGVMHLERARVR